MVLIKEWGFKSWFLEEVKYVLHYLSRKKPSQSGKTSLVSIWDKHRRRKTVLKKVANVAKAFKTSKDNIFSQVM